MVKIELEVLKHGHGNEFIGYHFWTMERLSPNSNIQGILGKIVIYVKIDVLLKTGLGTKKLRLCSSPQKFAL